MTGLYHFILQSCVVLYFVHEVFNHEVSRCQITLVWPAYFSFQGKLWNWWFPSAEEDQMISLKAPEQLLYVCRCYLVWCNSCLTKLKVWACPIRKCHMWNWQFLHVNWIYSQWENSTFSQLKCTFSRVDYTSSCSFNWLLHMWIPHFHTFTSVFTCELKVQHVTFYTSGWFFVKMST